MTWAEVKKRNVFGCGGSHSDDIEAFESELGKCTEDIQMNAAIRGIDVGCAVLRPHRCSVRLGTLVFLQQPLSFSPAI
jgi:hypothetical protein